MLRFPAIAQGAGHLFFDSPLSEAEKIALLREGIDRGMTLIDTAESYGKGLSEELVGKAVEGRRDKVLIASKVSPENLSYDGILSALEKSLKRLKTDTIDLYQIHWPNPAIPLEESLKAFAKLKKDGKIKAIGLCNFAKRNLEEAAKYLGDGLVTSYQTEYNLFERMIEMDGALNFCRAQNIQIIAYSPINPQKFSLISSRKLELLDKIAAGHNKTRAQIILAWIIQHAKLMPLVRTTRKDHLIENASASEIKLSSADLESINQKFSAHWELVPPGAISVASSENYNHSVYKSLDEALENRLGFSPSPRALAEEVKTGQFLKPVQLLRSKGKDGKEYELIVGAMRYWAWVIANGWQSPIPAYIYEKNNSK